MNLNKTVKMREMHICRKWVFIPGRKNVTKAKKRWVRRINKQKE
jgi:hypothetical protein